VLGNFIDELRDGVRGVRPAADLHSLGRAKELVRDRGRSPRSGPPVPALAPQ